MPNGAVLLPLPDAELRDQRGRVALASQQHYLSLCTRDARHIAAFREHHPGIRTGKVWSNLRDRNDPPLADLATVVDSALRPGL